MAPTDVPRSVFVPVTAAELNALRTEGTITGAVRAFGVTDALLRWGEFGPEDVEDATFAAQTFAECQALTHPDAAADERRIVLALADDGFVAEDPDGFGLGSLPGVQWVNVLAVFADDSDTDVRAAREAVRGMALEQAWADPQVEALIDEHELGWYEPSEVTHW